jgi:hypothetical protein
MLSTTSWRAVRIHTSYLLTKVRGFIVRNEEKAVKAKYSADGELNARVSCMGPHRKNEERVAVVTVEKET